MMVLALLLGGCALEQIADALPVGQHRVAILDDRLDEQAASDFCLFVSQVLGLGGVEPETERDESDDADAKDKTKFEFQPGFTKESFERAIRHGRIVL